MPKTRFLWALAPILTSMAAQAEPEDRGPLAITELDAGDVPADTTTVPLAVHYPSTGGGYPVVVVMHGNFRTGQYHQELAQTLASRGMVVLLPDMPCGFSGCNHEENARQLRDLLAWATGESSGTGPLAGKIDSTRQALLGHSFGGLGVFLAARMPGLSAVVMFDPRDNFNLAETDAPMISIPNLHVMASVAGVCNDDWATAVYPGTAAPHLRVRVVGAGHCDAESPSDNLCPTLCGQGDPSTSYLFRRYAVSFLGCVLTADPSYAPHVGGSGLDTDVAMNRIADVDQAGLTALPCQLASPNDAGVAIDGGTQLDAAADTGPSDSGAPIAADSGVAPLEDAGAPMIDAGTLAADSGVNVSDAGPRDRGSITEPRIAEEASGCSATAVPRSTSLPLACLLGLCLLRRVRRT